LRSFIAHHVFARKRAQVLQRPPQSTVNRSCR
jgi:hypothetical protein